MSDKCTDCRYKNTQRDEECKKLLKNRINRLIGQLGGIDKMLDDNRYCGDILIQISAAQSALSSLGYEILRNHMETCVVDSVLDGDNGIMNETVELIKKLR